MIKMRMMSDIRKLINVRTGYNMEDFCVWTVWHDNDDGDDVPYEAVCC